MQFQTEREYWQRYSMVVGSYLFGVESALDEHSRSKISVFQLCDRISSLSDEYRRNMTLVENVAKPSIRPPSGESDLDDLV